MLWKTAMEMQLVKRMCENLKLIFLWRILNIKPRDYTVFSAPHNIFWHRFLSYFQASSAACRYMLNWEYFSIRSCPSSIGVVTSSWEALNAQAEGLFLSTKWRWIHGGTEESNDFLYIFKCCVSALCWCAMESPEGSGQRICQETWMVVRTLKIR